MNQIAKQLQNQWLELECLPIPWPDVSGSCLDEARAACCDDQVCCLLVVLAQSGDQLAGRVVLQALLPQLTGLARRDARRTLDDYVAAGWLKLMCFPIATRRRAVLTNLALDTLKSLTRAEPNREFPTAQLPEVETAPAELSVRRLISASRQLHLVSDQTAAVLTSVYADGLSGREAALRHQMSETTLRYRCSSATKKLRANAELLVSAA